MNEISSLDHLAAKVDALTQKFDKMNSSVVTPAPVSPPCEVCGVFGHIGVEYQLGSVVYNQGMRPNQNFYNQTPQNPFRQTTPPGYANNQRVLQKSSLELLLENCLMDQSKHYEEHKNQTGFLNDSLTKLTLKVDSIATHNKMLETQFSQVVQQMVASSQTTGIFPCQTETNPKDPISIITIRDGKQLEDSIVKVKNNEGEILSDEPQSEKVIGENEKPLVSPPHEPKILLTQGFAKSKLDEQFRIFIEILPNKLSPKLNDLENFSIPCVIGSETIEKVMCDLGENVSLIPLSLSERLDIG